MPKVGKDGSCHHDISKPVWHPHDNVFELFHINVFYDKDITVYDATFWGEASVSGETGGINEKDWEKELEAKRRLAEVLRKEKESLEKKVGPLELALEEHKSLLREAQEESHLLALQFESLKGAVYQMQEKNDQLQNEFIAAKNTLQEAIGLMEEQKNKLLLQEKEIEEMKQALIRSQKEVNAIRQQYQNALQDKACMMQKLSQMQQNNQSQKEVWMKQLEEMKSAQTTLALEQQKKREAEAKLDKIQTFLVEKDQKIKELQEKVATVIEDKHALQTKVDSFETVLREKVADLKEAEQHLAKKVKESSFVLEQNDEQKALIATLRMEIDQKGGKFAEIQGLMDAKTQNEKRLLEQIERLEDKYLKTHEKLQKAEARLKEYKGLEEKHTQMKSLLANLGNFIETEASESSFAKKLSIKAISTPVRPKGNDLELDLFTSFKTIPPMKESLFDE
jgi:chromosome segregation ATPase